MALKKDTVSTVTVMRAFFFADFSSVSLVFMRRVFELRLTVADKALPPSDEFLYEDLAD